VIAGHTGVVRWLAAWGVAHALEPRSRLALAATLAAGRRRAGDVRPDQKARKNHSKFHIAARNGARLRSPAPDHTEAT
jgi:hypothetical protein